MSVPKLLEMFVTAVFILLIDDWTASTLVLTLLAMSLAWVAADAAVFAESLAWPAVTDALLAASVAVLDEAPVKVPLVVWVY